MDGISKLKFPSEEQNPCGEIRVFFKTGSDPPLFVSEAFNFGCRG